MVQYQGEFNSLSTASIANADVQVSNGILEDSGGNRLYFGNDRGTGAVYNGVKDLYVDRVRGASPSGDLKVDTNDNIYVSGYGDVTLTDPSNRRSINTVTNNNNENGTIKTDGSANIELEYTETTTTTETKKSTSSINDVNNFPVGTTTTVPSDGDNVNMSGAAKVDEDAASTSCIDCNVAFDTDGDGISDNNKSFTECGGDLSNTEVGVSNVGTGQKSVEINLSSNDLEQDSDFFQSTARIEWEEDTTTTTTETTLITIS